MKRHAQVIVDNMVSKHIITGAIGEKMVANHLKRKGFIHLESNFRAKTGEIDLILTKNSKIHFIEVKTVSREIRDGVVEDVSRGTHRPEDNVHRDKLRKIFNTVQIWISKNRYVGEWQLDVASVIFDSARRKARVTMIDNIVLE